MTDTEKLLGMAYAKVLEVNLDTEEFTALCLRDDERIKGNNFTDWIHIFVDEKNIVNDFEVKLFLNSLSISNLMERDVGIFYHRNVGDKIVPVYLETFRSTKWDSDNHIILLAVKYLTFE